MSTDSVPDLPAQACGCNLSVDRHEAQDLDGIVDKLEDIQTDLAKVGLPRLVLSRAESRGP